MGRLSPSCNGRGIGRAFWPTSIENAPKPEVLNNRKLPQNFCIKHLDHSLGHSRKQTLLRYKYSGKAYFIYFAPPSLNTRDII